MGWRKEECCRGGDGMRLWACIGGDAPDRDKGANERAGIHAYISYFNSTRVGMGRLTNLGNPSGVIGEEGVDASPCLGTRVIVRAEVNVSVREQTYIVIGGEESEG